MKPYIIFLFLFVTCSCASAQDVIDLGIDGGTCPVTIQSAPIVNSDIPAANEPSYSAHLEKWTNGSYSQPRPDMLKMYVGKTVFVFGANDQASEAAASKIKADLGLCVDYKNLQDISGFRERTKMAFPVELANDYIVSVFGLKSYPVLVRITENTLEYSTDF